MQKTTVEAIKIDRVRTFSHLTERFCQLLAREGLTVRPYEGDGPRHYLALTDDRQAEVLSRFETYVGVCVETVAGGWSLKDDAQVLWRMFKALRVHPCHELMSAFEQGDVIEIYDSSFTQVFRNLAFFSICSYTLDELLSRPFWELFKRDEQVTGEIVKVATGILGGELKGVHQWTLDVHSVSEMDSPALYHMEMQEKIASALQDAGGTPVAILSTCRILSCVSRTTGADMFASAKVDGGVLGQGQGAHESE